MSSVAGAWKGWPLSSTFVCQFINKVMIRKHAKPIQINWNSNDFVLYIIVKKKWRNNEWPVRFKCALMPPCLRKFILYRIVEDIVLFFIKSLSFPDTLSLQEHARSCKLRVSSFYKNGEGRDKYGNDASDDRALQVIQEAKSSP